MNTTVSLFEKRILKCDYAQHALMTNHICERGARGDNIHTNSWTPDPNPSSGPAVMTSQLINNIFAGRITPNGRVGVNLNFMMNQKIAHDNNVFIVRFDSNIDGAWQSGNNSMEGREMDFRVGQTQGQNYVVNPNVSFQFFPHYAREIVFEVSIESFHNPAIVFIFNESNGRFNINERGNIIIPVNL